MNEAAAPKRSIAKRIALFATWPVRRFFDPRFAALSVAIEQSACSLSETVQGHAQSIAFLTEENRRVAATVAALLDRLEPFVETMELEKVMEAGVDALDERQARFLNFASSHVGFSAERELWFNSALTVAHKEGDVVAGSMNERVVEVPYVMRGLAGLAPPAQILDVGCAESTVAISLASLGYRVTALDLRPYPLAHPNLTSVAMPLESWKTEVGTFDAVICLSSIEHFGLGSYESDLIPNADRAALKRLGELLKPNGRLILTVPFGVASVDEFQRVYDLPALEELLDGWIVGETTVVEQRSALEWVRLDEAPTSPVAGRAYVAMVTATAGNVQAV